MHTQIKKVLVVEDEFLVRLDVAQQLEDEGFDVVSASTADEALSVLLDGYTIHLLFTDVNMPGELDGLDLANQVWKHWPHVQLIITSARNFDGAELPDHALFVPKPYDIQALINVIHTLSKPH